MGRAGELSLSTGSTSLPPLGLKSLQLAWGLGGSNPRLGSTCIKSCSPVLHRIQGTCNM